MPPPLSEGKCTPQMSVEAAWLCRGGQGKQHAAGRKGDAVDRWQKENSSRWGSSLRSATRWNHRKRPLTISKSSRGGLGGSMTMYDYAGRGEVPS